MIARAAHRRGAGAASTVTALLAVALVTWAVSLLAAVSPMAAIQMTAVVAIRMFRRTLYLLESLLDYLTRQTRPNPATG